MDDDARPFPNVSPGAVLRALIQQATARRASVAGFSAVTDSAGVTWATTCNPAYDLGARYGARP